MKAIRNSLYLLSFLLIGCGSGTEKQFKKACINVEMLKNHKFVTVDSCFTAPTRDSLDRLLANFKKKQEEFLDYSSKLFFVIVDTLNKEPEEYQYALVQSDAGIINPDVVLTTDPSIVKEKSDKFGKGNIHFHKLVLGETLSGQVEYLFKMNIRINYRTESNVKISK
jgi:hypothetical protein